MAHRLEEIRKSKGITQTHIARQLGYKNSSYYSIIEKDKNFVPKLDMAYRLSEILGEPLDVLFPNEKILA
ncbi:helix-turn-helix transcriptional regulator [Salinicoccus roseus]|uniref:helix-turn-helix transcriptional regulator n=1 Tax=Salinicoccus roseus TaxID=45670 RepID=UPI00356785F8